MKDKITKLAGDGTESNISLTMTVTLTNTGNKRVFDETMLMSYHGNGFPKKPSRRDLF